MTQEQFKQAAEYWNKKERKKIEVLFSDFKKDGYDVRQTLTM